MSAGPLSEFDPRVSAWFARRFGAATEIQRLAWPVIVAGDHALVTAPTGTGKTLAGFLWPLDRLLTGRWEGGGVRVLYVSPLKALNADIERNLRAPLAEIAACLRDTGAEPAPVRVGVRSGDTPAAERARMLRRPPEILITTPESLNLLLLSPRAGEIFGGLRLALLDEIHAVVTSKRGTQLVTAVERLARLAGEFQRLALSATVSPADQVARFVAGYQLVRGAGGEARYRPRPMTVVTAGAAAKRYDLQVRWGFAPGAEPGGERQGDDAWKGLAAELRDRILERRSSLVFTNSRRLAERLTRFVNEAAGRDLAWSHHGSLSREIRDAVEARMKEGTLPAIVATSSLELGIDVGALDRVLLVQSPRSLAAAAQRIGRAGHRAGETSAAIFYPTFGRDFLDAAVAVEAVRAGEIEPLRALRAPLDLLAQTVLALCARERWPLDGMYDFLRCAAPYRELSRAQFDLVVEMLAGRYSAARLEELRPRVRVDRLAGTVEGRPGLAGLLARGGGTIPDRGYFKLRVEGSGALLGELDEEFVWERSVGDGFVLGAQGWRVHSIGADEVRVTPARGGALLAPFWRADARDRGSFFSERVARLLEWAERELDGGGLADELARRFGFAPAAAAELERILREQRAALGVALPHRRHLVVEELPPTRVDDRREVILHTFWGGTVNRPLALALAALWQERTGDSIEVVSDDDALLLTLPPEGDAARLLAELDPDRLEELLRRRLEASGFFGAHFRQNAQRALLLPRSGPARRTPLWLSRQRAKRLLETVAELEDFPLVIETWRTCLQDEFELDALRDRLRELAAGEIRVRVARGARPSPFAAQLLWRRTGELMYEDDTPAAGHPSRLRGDLLREVALDAASRPAVSRALAERYRRTAQRLLAGYAPRDAEELLDWVKERSWIPSGEWRELLAAIDGERGEAGAAELVAQLGSRLARGRTRAGSEGILARETLLADAASLPLAHRLDAVETLAGERLEVERPAVAPSVGALAAWLGPWLRFQGPLEWHELVAATGGEREELGVAVESLVEQGRAVRGPLVAGSEGESVCSLSSLETLLRWRRAEARPRLEALPLARLPLAVAWRQGLVERAGDAEGLRSRLESLFGFPAPAGLWEREILPARLDPYLPAWLDALVDETDLRWFGVGPQRVTFALRGDFDLFGDAGDAARVEAAREPLAAELARRLARAPRGLELGELVEATGATAGEVARSLWELAWEGAATNDSVRALRQGVLSDFRVPDAAVGEPAAIVARPSRRASFRRWSATRSFAGRWHAVRGGPEAMPADALYDEELRRERVRLLAERYGVVFRELLAAELPSLAWSRLARTLRTLELAGELVAGQFFAGVRGLQFAAPRFAAELASGPPEGAIWWHSALDPASLCGVDLPELKARLPERRGGTWLAWRGSELALVCRRGGRELDFRVPPGDPALAALVEPLRVALTRGFDPERALTVEVVNGEPAERSPYRDAFAAFSVTRETRGIKLRRRFGAT